MNSSPGGRVKRTNTSFLGTIARSAPLLILCVAGSMARASNPVFQSFFLANVCNNPSGELADRCTEFTGTVGDLSGDSESSLNPSHSLSNNDTALERALNYSKQARERGEDARVEGEGDRGEEPTVDFGRWSLVFQVRGSSYESDKIVDVDAERGFEGDYYGSTIGFDYRLSNRAYIGIQLGYDKTDQDFVGENPGVNFDPEPIAGAVESDTVSLSLVGSINLTEKVFFLGALGFGDTQYDLYRNSIFQESGRTPDLTRRVQTYADVDGEQTWATLSIGTDFGQRAVSFGPYFGVTRASSELDAYAEQEISPVPWGLGMSYGATERDSLLGYAGFSANITRSTPTGVFSAQFRAEYQHESDKDPVEVTTSFLLDQTGATYALKGDEVDRDQVELAFGVLKVMAGGWQPYFDVAVLTGNSNFDRYRWAAGFRKEF
jgi:outer membrane autotransporter protein